MYSPVPEELFQTIVDETNRYVRQNPRTPSSHMKGWEGTTVQEVCSYVGLRFPMGLQSKRDQREWWSTDPLMSSSVFAKTMTRDRYDALTSALHFAAEDRLWKLRPVLDVLESTYRSVFVPNKNVTVDESLWAFKGCHHAIQYNPSKRARRGLKVYKLCSSDGPEAGYTAAFKIYMGQDRGVFPSSKKAITDLLEKADLLDKGYQLHTDNWYTSPTLFHYLQARKTSAVGTVRLNGVACPRTCSKVVTLPPNRRGVERSKPEVVVDYNNGMKGVDLSDQLAQSYPSTKKTVKWYKKIFFYLLDMTTTNALAIHRALGGKLTQYEFRKELVRGLLQQGGPRGSFRRNPPQARHEEEVTQQAHLPVDTRIVGGVGVCSAGGTTGAGGRPG
ncbi:piggyBac transposable element-derived protein 4-like [Penaeus monodon]|uniref:piggyBac transposable element-derived protein 4-like n=1 Tax=Penaeus monodon TaxID=6687 RepID=UPI0018A7157A|nr:piggyBac transposable element-derived protein 4-like [Penaeus monodon]